MSPVLLAIDDGETVFEMGNVTLKAKADRLGAVPASVLVGALPDGVEKRRFIIDCMGCHQLNHPIVFDEEGQVRNEAAWRAATQKMIAFCGPSTTFPILPPDRLPDATARWVARYLTHDRLGEQVEQAMAILEDPLYLDEMVGAGFTEYEFPRADDLPVPDLPHDLMMDGEGGVLVTGMFSGAIYRLNPVSGEFVSHAIPIPLANPRALDIDAQGNWWIVLGAPKKLARYSPTSAKWDLFDVGMYPHSTMIDSEGRIWFNGHFTQAPPRFGYLDADADTTRVFEAPPTDDGIPPIPYGLRVGPDGTVWGTELAGNRLVRFDPKSEAIEVYRLPSEHSGPRRLDIDRDGVVWIPLYAANKLARFDPRSDAFTEFDCPTPNSLPYCARIDHDRGLVWISQTGNDAIARFDIESEEFVEYRLPTRIAFVRHLDIDPRSGHVWGTYSQSPGVHPKVVRLDPGESR